VAAAFAAAAFVGPGTKGDPTGASEWVQSYTAGYTDANGAWAGGSEIMHLVPHRGKLFAANGYWKDSRWERPVDGKQQSAQVLRLDRPDGVWQVDLDTGAGTEVGGRYMKGNILKSLTFASDGARNMLDPPRKMLVMAAGNIGSHVSTWVRDDATGRWTHCLVKSGVPAHGVRWVPRDMEVYRDKVTGIERVFLVLGNPGIISGVYDASQPPRIRWDAEAEFPGDGPFTTRPLGITEANSKLYFSVGGSVYERQDGPAPTYRVVLSLGGHVNTDVGGIRGLTTIPCPNGAGESMLFLWAPRGRAPGQIKRLDPGDHGGYTVHDEANMRDFMQGRLGVEVLSILGGYNDLAPFADPASGETVHIIGFQGVLRGSEHLQWEGSRYYAGAMYAVRRADRTYTVNEVNGPYQSGKRVLVAPRTFCLSPFGDNTLFVGGHDANFRPSDNMAWIFKAPLRAALTGDVRETDH